MRKTELSPLSEFKRDVSFAISEAHKPLVWIETFDYSYVMDIVCSLNIQGWVWNKSTGEVNDLLTNSILSINKRKIIYDELSECIIKILKQPGFKILVARVSSLLFSKDTKLIPAIQDFVFNNNRKKFEDKQTIVLISNVNVGDFELDHLCERFTLPLPDVEDIDTEFGFIQDKNLKSQRDINPEISLEKDIIIDVGEEIRLKVNPEIDEDGNRFYNLKNERIGIIRRDINGKVERIILPRTSRYIFASGFKSRVIEKVGNKKVETNLETRYQELVESLRGMYLYDIKQLLDSIIAKGDGTIRYRYEGQTLSKTIKDRKKQIVNNSGLLEVIDYGKEYWKNVADIDNLLKHVEIVKRRFDNPSECPPKIPKPKGILLVGAPGCGKSESAKAIASKLDKPLYRLNIGNLLGHKYGQSENRFIDALRTADASAPCVLMIDEIEKAFAGAGNESENDDTLTHIVGHFLTWMQEHQTMVYLVATANDVSRMKPEMLRKGRWDETFYLNYPSMEGCKSILLTISQVKFELKLIYADSIEIETVAETMSLFPMSGAEIENTIINTITNNPKYENGTWVIYVKDIANTLLNSLIEINELNRSDIDDPLIKLKEYCNQKKDNKNSNKDDDPFISAKVEEEIQEMEIRSYGKISKDDYTKLRQLLLKKYKKQYKYKSASLSNNKTL